MFKRFLWLEWKSFFRSASVGKSIGLKVLLIFLALYFSVAFLALGIGLYPLLQEYFPDQDPLQLVNRFVLLWLVFYSNLAGSGYKTAFKFTNSQAQSSEFCFE